MFKKITQKVTQEAKDVVSKEVQSTTDKWIPIAVTVIFAVVGACTSPRPAKTAGVPANITINNYYYGCGGKCHV